MATTIFDCEFTERYIVDIIYPIGSIYMTVENTNPETLFPGTTWESIQNKFLAASGSLFSAGSIGGAKESSYTPTGTVAGYALTENDIPSHAHNIYNHTHESNTSVVTSSNGAHTHSIKNEVAAAGTNSNEVDIRKPSRISSDEEDPGGRSSGTQNGIDYAGAHTHTITGNSAASNDDTGSTGGGQAHNHVFTADSFTVHTLPPYLAVYMWKRTE